MGGDFGEFAANRIEKGSRLESFASTEISTLPSRAFETGQLSFAPSAASRNAAFVEPVDLALDLELDLRHPEARVGLVEGRGRARIRAAVGAWTPSAAA